MLSSQENAYVPYQSTKARHPTPGIDTHPGKQEMLCQVTGFPLSMWENWVQSWHWRGQQQMGALCSVILPCLSDK